MDCNAEKKQISADYVDKKQQAAEKYIQAQTFMLLEQGIRIYCPYEKEPYEVTARCGDQVQIRPSKAWRTDEMSNMLNDLWLQTEPQEPQPPAGPVAVLREHTSGQEITPSLETGVTASPVTDHNPVQKQPLPRGPGRATRRPKRRSNFD